MFTSKVGEENKTDNNLEYLQPTRFTTSLFLTRFSKNKTKKTDYLSHELITEKFSNFRLSLCKKYHLVYYREINLWPDVRGIFRTLSSTCDRCSAGFEIPLRVSFSVCVPNISRSTYGNTICNAAECLKDLILSLQGCPIFKGIKITKWKAIKKNAISLGTKMILPTC